MDSLVRLAAWAATVVAVIVIGNIVRQLLPRKSNEPPTVFHWVPIVGNAISYGMDPPGFYAKCREKYGDVFCFTLFGQKMMCYFGVNGNDFILNGKHQDLNAEEVYGPLTVPVFGTDVVYGCPNAKFMQQKKFVKFALTQKALEGAVPIVENEVADYIKTSPGLKGRSGTFDVSKAMSELNIFTASRALQGEEIRAKLTREYANVYHDLDNGLQPVNFLLPWFPFPHNRKRDLAHIHMRNLYMEAIEKRRKQGAEGGEDMIWNLMHCQYKDGNSVPDKEIAHMMITMLLGGQHSSSSSSGWIILHIAARPDIGEMLYDEQVKNLSVDGKLPPLKYSDLDKLVLMRNVIKETLRTHSSIHTVMRKATRTLEIPGSPYIVPAGTTMVSSPLLTQLSDEHFPNAAEWNPRRWEGKAEADDADDADDDAGDLAFSKGAKSPYLPFGAGRHRCIGEKFAYLNLGVIVATFVRHFRLTTLDGSATLPPTDYSSLFSRPQQPAIIRWERRSSDDEKA